MVVASSHDLHFAVHVHCSLTSVWEGHWIRHLKLSSKTCLTSSLLVNHLDRSATQVNDCACASSTNLMEQYTHHHNSQCQEILSKLWPYKDISESAAQFVKQTLQQMLNGLFKVIAHMLSGAPDEFNECF
eukprot:2686079-Amphidinium_carterae.1